MVFVGIRDDESGGVIHAHKYIIYIIISLSYILDKHIKAGQFDFEFGLLIFMTIAQDFPSVWAQFQTEKQKPLSYSSTVNDRSDSSTSRISNGSTNPREMFYS